MSISISGLICFQVYWIHLTLKEKEREFDQKINEILAEVEDEIKDSEAKKFLKKFDVSKTANLKIYTDQTIAGDSLFAKHLEKNKLFSKSFDSLKIKGKSVFITSSSEEAWKMREKDSSTLPKHTTIVRYQKKKDKLTEIVNEMSLAFAFQEMSLEERIDSINIKALLSKALIDHGITDIDYSYSVRDLNKDTVVHSISGDSSLQVSSFERKIFTDDRSTAGLLSINVPNKRGYMLKKIWWLLLISFLLTGIMIFTFAYTISGILRQKKISQIKADFINNMTHEFKTPIATISLAIDSILHKKVKGKPREVERLGDIIKKENSRMNQQVESLLEMALFDKEEIKLHFEEINVHDLIKELYTSYELKTNSKDGEIQLNLAAMKTYIMADKMHLYNAIRNLIDNGIKYSKQKFKLIIESNSDDQSFSIKVSDNGIGMDSETQKRVFDRFYRKTGGNLHPTKGFGLGLSYVKEIVERMGGRVSVMSKINEGSTFCIHIPFIEK